MPNTRTRTEEQRERRRQTQSARRKLAARFVADLYSRNPLPPRDPENLQQTWKPRTASGRTLAEEDELLDRLYQFGHEYAKDDTNCE